MFSYWTPVKTIFHYASQRMFPMNILDMEELARSFEGMNTGNEVLQYWSACASSEIEEDDSSQNVADDV